MLAGNFGPVTESELASPEHIPNRMASSTTVVSAALAQRAAQICLDSKANDVVILSLKGVSDVADFFIIASGTSDTHVRSIAARRAPWRGGARPCVGRITGADGHSAAADGLQ